jgi:hypothetical protein
MTSSGRCLCGAVRFTAEEVETDHHACHCGMCRRWSGGGPFFAAHVRGVVFAGEEKLAIYESSEWARRGFCGACGTTLFYFLKPTQEYMMSVGGAGPRRRRWPGSGRLIDGQRGGVAGFL